MSTEQRIDQIVAEFGSIQKQYPGTGKLPWHVQGKVKALFREMYMLERKQIDGKINKLEHFFLHDGCLESNIVGMFFYVLIFLPIKFVSKIF